MYNNKDYPALQERVTLPYGYSVEFSWSSGCGIETAWSPDIPEIANGRARRRFLKEYVAARNSFYGQIATLTGKTIGIVGLPLRASPDILTVIQPSAVH
jgi:hypothetical protein